MISTENLLTAAVISGIASMTPKADEKKNEDAVAAFRGGVRSFHGVAVADGLGSYTHAREAARIVVDETALLAETLDLSTSAGLYKLFSQVRQSLRARVRGHNAPSAFDEATFGTTLLVAVETRDEILVAYVGNGAVWHISGNFEEATIPQKIPWNSVNYLRPHSIFREGREILCNLLAPDEQFDRFPPTVLTINKDRHFGDILLICTDGIHSADQIRHGTDADGDAWIRSEPSIVLFHEHLRRFFAESCGYSDIKPYMQNYLRDLSERRLLEDDASLGLIITDTALAYQQQRRSS